ncbi:hypothetical protein [Brevundimonas aveniformis]|uniref:hypothetical protein n=1 Tax=Brevundimonas aveniformis TaxID=370977 RepID=UPI0003F6B358|nr:hypothetical protein [Brevundimonas aveniformis]
MRRVLPLAVIALALTACEGGGDPVEQALREEAANNHAEAEFARQQQAAERAARAAERQTEIDRLNREIAVAEVALEAASDSDVRATAQASLDESRRALAALEGEN